MSFAGTSLVMVKAQALKPESYIALPGSAPEPLPSVSASPNSVLQQAFNNSGKLANLPPRHDTFSATFLVLAAPLMIYGDPTTGIEGTTDEPLTITNVGSVSPGTALMFFLPAINGFTDGLFCQMLLGGMPTSIAIPAGPVNVNVFITSDMQPLNNNQQLVQQRRKHTTITPAQATSIIQSDSAAASGTGVRRQRYIYWRATPTENQNASMCLDEDPPELEAVSAYGGEDKVQARERELNREGDRKAASRYHPIGMSRALDLPGFLTAEWAGTHPIIRVTFSRDRRLTADKPIYSPMPELDILHGFEYTASQLKESWQKLHGGQPLTAYLQIFPRVFAVGTKKKSYTTCTVDTGELCDYQESLEPVPEDYSPDKADLSKAKGKPFARYLKPLTSGELFVRARGKEIVFAAGYHLVRAHFGLEGTIVVVKTEDYHVMVSNDCPGNNSNSAKASRMRSFVVPPHLTIQGARGLQHGERQQTMAIFAAIVGQEHTILLVDHNRLLRMHIMSRAQHWKADDLVPKAQHWLKLWSENHGPDWIYEKTRAELVLDDWRQQVLTQAASLDLAQEPSLLDIMCSSQDVFNGYGQHTAHDVLHMLRLFPTTSPTYVCSDEAVFDRFKAGLSSYGQQYTSATYRERCLCLPNSSSPLAFNYTSNDNYLNQYVKVYRKSTVRMPRDEYNLFASEGLFNREHVIAPNNSLGMPYEVQVRELIQTSWKEVPVYQFTQGGKNPIYSVIVAKRPASWRYGGDQVVEVTTTLGPASFHMFKENQYGWEDKGKAGRKPVENVVDLRELLHALIICDTALLAAAQPMLVR
ncbi:hypothetical protein ACG7TL_003385 [Trametes sanguinea]